MKTLRTKLITCIVLSFLVFTLVFAPLSATAASWWIKEVTYTLQGRTVEHVTGTQSRIYLPEVKATLRDGIEMSVNYQISKDGEVLICGTYEKGVYYDLSGEGTYVFTYKGIDASNEYSFSVVADAMYPSIILEQDIAVVGYTDEPFIVPDGKIIYNSTEVSAQVTLTMENGNQYVIADKIVPEVGKMTVTYSADFEGKTISFSYDADILNSTIGFYDETGAFYSSGQKAYEHKELSGSVLNGLSTKYTFSEIIDLSEATTEHPIVVLNNAATTQDVRVLPKVKIVDVYDSQNYIEIVGRWNANNATVVYSVAKAPKQAWVGFLNDELYTQSIFGTLTNFPTSFNASKEYPAAYYYNAEEKAVYASYHGSLLLISDLDADYQTFPWDGFTTGEVYIVVERSAADDYVCVESVAGFDLSSSQRDYVSPAIRVDMGIYTEAPYAVVGEKYPVFNATAVDFFDSKVPVTCSIYKGCDATSGVKLNLTDGCFVPYEAGNYTVAYYAEDSFGNQAVKKVNVLAINAETAPPITAQITAIPERTFVGEKIELPPPENISGGSGSVGYQVMAEYADGTKEELSEDYIIFKQEGVHTVKYILTDYLGQSRTYAFDIDCSRSESPILYRLVMPNYLRSGKLFTLPEAEFYEADTVEVYVEAFLDGQEIEIVDNAVTPVTEKEKSELIVTYYAKNATGSSSQQYQITVLNGDISQRTSYFQATQGDMVIEQGPESLRFTCAQSYSGVRFINSVLAARLNLAFRVDPKQNNSDRITIYLTDSMDPNVQIRLDVVKKQTSNATSKSDFYINGIKANDMVGNFYGGTDALQLSFSAKSNSFIDASGTTLGSVTKTINGEVFSGFPSGEVNIVVSTGAVGEQGFCFELLQINNQNFYNDDMFFDSYAELNLLGSLVLQTEIGSQVTIPAAIAGDVLSPNAEVTVTVKKGAETIISQQSAKEPFNLTFDTYGKYQVTYHYTDGVMSRSANYTINTMENNPPTAQLPKDLPNTAKLNQTIRLTMPDVSDDYTQDVTVSILVMEPNGNMILINKEQMTFVTRYTGTYNVIYQVYDECYNYHTLTHTVEVTDGEN